MTTITLELHQAADCLPDADTDVLVLAEGDEETQLGALVGNEPRELVTRTGQRVDLAAPWAVPV